MSMRSSGPTPIRSGIAISSSILRGQCFSTSQAPARVTAAQITPLRMFEIYRPFICIAGIKTKLHTTTPIIPSTTGSTTDMTFRSAACA